jgi:hypothetical protein
MRWRLGSKDERDAEVGGLTVFQVCPFPEEMDHGSSRVGGLSGQSDDGGAHSRRVTLGCRML